MTEWQLVPYTSRSGRNPVAEYLDSISVDEVARIEIALDLLAEFGIQLGMPHVRPITRELWELRIRGKTQHRILYVSVQNRQFLLLHAFTKKTQATPARAIKLALDRLADYQERNALMKDYFERRAASDPEFRNARERLRPEYEFRRALIRARIDSNLTQADLAERVGTTQSAIARLESGGAEPSFNMLRRLSTALNVSFEIMPSTEIHVHHQDATTA